MKTLSWFATLGLAMALPAHADRLPLPADAPPSYQAECGTCHLPYPPALLTATDWKRVMGALDRHYGDNATLDEPTRREIAAFLLRHAATHNSMAANSNPPRLTSSEWFRREHRRVPESSWKDPDVKSSANCGGCHTKAEAGSFRESEIVLPTSRRRL
ncbi:MAG: diheme cytochrome c [Betaproteobacteria bacterium]|nr:diheme cytochrome c [Betaproteobacteria bacterium]